MRLIIFAVAVCCALPASVHAGVMFSLSSSTNLSALALGDQFTVSVELSGMEAGDTLNFIGAEVLFDGALLGAVGDPQPGTAIPIGSEGNFASGSGLGFASGLFDDFFPDLVDPVTSNGSFFTFDLKAQSAGSGQIAFNSDPFATFVLGFDALGDPLDTVSLGSALDFTIVSPTVNPIPEPSSLVLFGLGTLGLAGYRGRRRPVCAQAGAAA